ncbi:MAG: NAD(P)/FAD-dependent oxidoreductase [Pseudomonadota bacterium]
MRAPAYDREPDFDVIIIGAGVSGVGAARHLTQRCPDRSFAILEAREAMGGTWDLFRYPGIRSDSDMYTFGYASKPWTGGKAFADGEDIKSYVEEAARETGVDQHIRYGHRMQTANWDSQAGLWTVRVAAQDGEQSLTCRFLMMCSGYYRYDQGYMPDFEGADRFGGEIVHPQHWPEGLDYTGKRVVVIGSGATAVTLVPAMAHSAEHVTMLQRSPTYIAARPSRDAVADFLRKWLPGKLAYGLSRAKNIGFSIFFYELSQRFPDFVKKGVIKEIQTQLGEDFDVERHFTPSYKPWDQRFCLAPDGDFFAALKAGEASIVTDTIDRFSEEGVVLSSGDVLEADIIIPATGLEMQIAGGASLTVDGRLSDPAEHFTYRGMMLSQIPNLALTFGYTNASWTLKIDLTCERVCRMLNHMRRTGDQIAVALPPEDIEPLPLLDFSSGYVQRALAGLPRQGSEPPWRTYQNYVQDMFAIRYGRLDDGHMVFFQPGALKPESLRPAGAAALPDLAEAAE